jgi:DNA polymerase III alpha subunit
MLNFPTPHCHPQSFDSASTPEAFAQREIELGTGALTVTDHGTMGACRRVYDLAKSKKLTPILGLEAYFRDDNCPILKAHGIENPAEYLKYYHLTIHCLDERAYQTLSQKLSHARVERHGAELKPLFNWEDLEAIGAENVTITSGCLVGMVQRHIFREGLDLPQRFQIAKAYYERLRALTRPGNWFVEVFPHKCDKNWTHGVFLHTSAGEVLRYWESKKFKFEHAGELHADRAAKLFATDKWVKGDRVLEVMNNRKWTKLDEPIVVDKLEHLEDFIPNECQPWCPDGDVQLGCNRVVAMLARQYGDKILISDDSHYAHPDEKIVQDIRLRQMGNWRFYGSYHRQSSEDAFTYFRDRQGVDEKTFEGWIENNREWAAKFKDFSFNSKPCLPTKFYPEKTLEHTGELVKKHGRMQWDNPLYVSRLKAEIELLHRNGTIDLLPYFFVIEEVDSFYESIGMLTGPGRGSAAGLLLAYLLGITHVDPLKYGLSMDRFLTVDRIKSGRLPDVDQDLPTRTPLIGDDGDGFDVQLDDGSTKTVTRYARVLTADGIVGVEEAFQKKLDVLEWL